MTHEEERVWLIEKLKAENPAYRKLPVPADEQAQKDFLRMLMNVRMPHPISAEFREIQDAYLKKENFMKGIVNEKMIEPCSLDPRLCIWQGDITRLGVDAITNAANSGMTGCYQPLHNCIDNCIHSAAGIELRNECARIMNLQGHDEPTGQAKITPGYCLPARYVLHTVGPIVQGPLTDEHRDLLRSSYRSCLELAEKNGLRSVAFCCISTGVFMFPAEEAAHIAVETVRKYLDEQDRRYSEVSSYIGSGAGKNAGGDTYKGIEKVIFNVFSDRDRQIYENILEK
jgi:O-acetyl-ADP-ribose deacetylase (regulator of RNase III)